MRPLFVVFGQPHVQIGLQFFDGTVQLLSECDVVEFVFDGAMEFGVVREATHHPVEDVNEQTGGALAGAMPESW